MEKKIFKMLAQLNKWIMPRISRKDITRLSKTDKLIVAYRYWVTKNALD
jgi:DNA-directed RNA polymerase subunit H (RpoH/RPB5)